MGLCDGALSGPLHRTLKRRRGCDAAGFRLPLRKGAVEPRRHGRRRHTPSLAADLTAKRAREYLIGGENAASRSQELAPDVVAALVLHERIAVSALTSALALEHVFLELTAGTREGSSMRSFRVCLDRREVDGSAALLQSSPHRFSREESSVIIELQITLTLLSISPAARAH